MARRLGWGQLKPATRKRYEGAGVTQAEYERGVSLAGARGHKNTPERPIPYGADVPKRFQKYYNYRYNKPMRMLTENGEVWLVSVSKRNRHWIGSHWNAIHAYLFGNRDARKGQPRKAWWWKGSYDTILNQFKKLTVHGMPLGEDGSLGDMQAFRFMTDPDAIEAWTYEDTLNFESLYKNVA